MLTNNKNKSVRYLGIGRFLLAAALCTLAACSRTAQPIKLQGQAQGTYYSILYIDPQQRDLQPMVDSLLQDFDQTASLWVENSLIRRLNRNETDTLTPLFADMLQKSLDIADYTEGAFNCRVGRLVQAWGFSFKQKEELNPRTIDSLMLLAHGRVSIDTTDDGTLLLRKEHPGTELDFNAIAQGYSVDLLAQMMQRLGIQNYLIDVGGEVIAHGQKADGTPWRVGIERPAENKYSAPEIETAIELRDLSVVTSGSYRKYYEKDGTKYSHTIDPDTGRPVQHSLLSASVVDSASWRADALATALMVMGRERSQQFIAQHPDDPALQTVFFIYDSAGNYATCGTPRFNSLIPQR